MVTVLTIFRENCMSNKVELCDEHEKCIETPKSSSHQRQDEERAQLGRGEIEILSMWSVLLGVCTICQRLCVMFCAVLCVCVLCVCVAN